MNDGVMGGVSDHGWSKPRVVAVCRTLGNRSVNNQFDLAGRITVANPGAQMERSFTYRANGQLETVSAPNTPWYNRVFAYDDLDRLTQALGPFDTIDYTYDQVGNRLSETRNSQTDTYAYTAGANRLQEISGQGLTAYTCDANGNVVGIGGRSLFYNQNNQLIRVEEGANTLASYAYNGLGQRVSKEIAGQTTLLSMICNSQSFPQV